MARPFRVPGVASPWEPSSSAKVSQDLPSPFCPPTRLRRRPPLHPLPKAIRRFPPAACFCDTVLHSIAVAPEIKPFEIERPLWLSGSRTDGPLITLMGTRVASMRGLQCRYEVLVFRIDFAWNVRGVEFFFAPNVTNGDSRAGLFQNVQAAMVLYKYK